MLRRNMYNEEQTSVSVEKSENKKSGKFVIILVVLFAVAIASFVWSFSNYRSYKKQVIFLSTPEGQQDLAQKEMDALLKKVGRHIILPTDEQPTVASVLDPETLAKDQPFYKGVQKGDKILIFVKAQKAIVYNETSDIIVNVGPVYLENKEQVSTPVEVPVAPEEQVKSPDTSDEDVSPKLP